MQKVKALKISLKTRSKVQKGKAQSSDLMWRNWCLTLLRTQPFANRCSFTQVPFTEVSSTRSQGFRSLKSYVAKPENLLSSAWHFFCLPNVRLQPRPISWIDRFPPINLGVCQSKSHLVISSFEWPHISQLRPSCSNTAWAFEMCGFCITTLANS